MLVLGPLLANNSFVKGEFQETNPTIKMVSYVKIASKSRKPRTLVTQKYGKRNHDDLSSQFGEKSDIAARISMLVLGPFLANNSFVQREFQETNPTIKMVS